jgi:hypothetical protein
MNWKFLYLVPILFFSLVGCGSSAIASTTPMPNTLQVNRDLGTINHYPPLMRTVTKASAIQALYKAALALPKASATGPVHSCPSAYDLIYHLFFYQSGVLIKQMDINPTGCPYITMNKNDMRPMSQAFIVLFAQTLGISQSQVDIQPIPQKTKPALHS